MPLTANIDPEVMETEGKPGQWLAGRKIGTRDIVIGLGLLGHNNKHADMMDAWLNLSDKLVKNEVKKLEFGNGLYCYAMMVGASDIEKKSHWSILDLTFRCFDPYIYGKDHEVTLKSGDNRFIVYGKANTYPIIEVTGTGTSKTVTNVNTGKKTKVDGLTSTTNLVINMNDYRCTVNGAYKAADPTVSDFWYIEPGEQVINLSSGSGKLKYTERYL